VNKVFVHSLGCKANFSDGQQIELGFLNQGCASTSDALQADFIVVNSCTVTDEANSQSEAAVRSFAKKNPNAKIIYTGCAAEVDPERALKISGVSAIVGNQNKTQLPQMVIAATKEDAGLGQPSILGSVTGYQEIASRHPMDREWPLPSTDGGMAMLDFENDRSTQRTRAFVNIQEGCNSFCTYCIIPYGRGPSRSVPRDQVVKRIQTLVDQGVKEVILTGTNIGDYHGSDTTSMSVQNLHPGQLELVLLIRSILSNTELKRLRVSSLDPSEITEDLIQLMESEPRFCPHFHVSLQHVNSKILKLMKRQYDFTQVENTLVRISKMTRQPFIGMDYIVGFPGETDQDFNDSVDVLKKLYWTRLHVFPYSERSGSPATKLPGVVFPHIRKERAKVLQALSLERMTALFSQERSQMEHQQSTPNRITEVLIEGSVRGPDGTREWVAGYSPRYQRVIVPKTSLMAQNRNQILDVPVRNWMIDRISGDLAWVAL
jgi:threonylcarbamoyladenosine tRNA methylthiotransferase MtaB